MSAALEFLNEEPLQESAGKLIVVANRLPLTISSEDGAIVAGKSGGGLASGLGAYMQKRAAVAGKANATHSTAEDAIPAPLWIGWAGSEIPPEQHGAVRKYAANSHNARPVFLSSEDVNHFYCGFCNDTVWPLFHYFPFYTKFSHENWEAYLRVNAAYADEVAAAYSPGDTIWIHDYHLMLLPAMLRERFPDAKIGFFLHIPFPSFEIFRLLPRDWAKAILRGMLGANLVGFHTHDYVQHFRRSVLRMLGVEHSFGQIQYGGRIVRADTFPMGIEFNRYAQAPTDSAGLVEWDNLERLLEGKKAVLSVDRLDYSKGIVHRLEAYELFLKQHPQWHGKVVLLAVVVPSREAVPAYEEMKQKIDQVVGNINGQFGRVGWTPVIYQYRSLDLHPLTAAYAASQVALVTPLRDGMNLVAKEYIAASVDDTGVLILSEMAGAAAELGEAIIVNPNNRQEMADAILTALEMPPEEQARRLRVMRQRLQSYDVSRWAEDFLSTLDQSHSAQNTITNKLLTGNTRASLVRHFKDSQRRLILTDYDGTLVGFHANPEQATPSARALDVLAKLAACERTSVALVSGRMQFSLTSWFGHLPLSLAAEHGACVRDADSDQWEQLAKVQTGWIKEVRPVMQLAADRLPGSFIEEKHLGISWHWRAADPELGCQRAIELAELLKELIARRDLQVLQGNKVIEVRSGNVNKGFAANHFLSRLKPDFILALGDDWTDEDMFRALPDNAYTVKVGSGRSDARYSLPDPNEVLALLDLLASQNI